MAAGGVYVIVDGATDVPLPVPAPSVIFSVLVAAVKSSRLTLPFAPLNVVVALTHAVDPRSIEPKLKVHPLPVLTVSTSLPVPPSVIVTVTTLFPPMDWFTFVVHVLHKVLSLTARGNAIEIVSPLSARPAVPPFANWIPAANVTVA